MTQEFLFVEKYRPQTIEETILADNLKTTFKEFVKKGELIKFTFIRFCWYR